MTKARHVYYVSGSTGLLAENMGKALLAQFQGLTFREQKLPFIQSVEDAHNAMETIRQNTERARLRGEEEKPLVFLTIMDQDICNVFENPEVQSFEIFLNTLMCLENVFGQKSLREPGHSRHFTLSRMNKRVDAIHYSLDHDDGTRSKDYDQAEIILTGVSRSGKTPVSVYIATHMEMKVANFPLTNDHLNQESLPPDLVQNKDRLVGLTSSAEYLHTIREKRYAGSSYASLPNCMAELEQARQLFQRHNLPVLNVEGKSIEELAVQAIQAIGGGRKGAKRPYQAGIRPIGGGGTAHKIHASESRQSPSSLRGRFLTPRKEK